MANRLWPSTTPSGLSSVTGVALTLGTEFYVTSAGLQATQISIWRAPGMSGPWPAGLWLVNSDNTSGGLLATVTIPDSGTDNTWQTVTLPTPVALTANQRYRAGYFASNWSYTGGYWSSGAGASDIISGPLVAPSAAHSINSRQSPYHSGAALSFPDTIPSPAGSNFWVDITVDAAGGTAYTKAGGGYVRDLGIGARALEHAKTGGGHVTETGTGAAEVTGGQTYAKSGGGHVRCLGIGAARVVAPVNPLARAVPFVDGVSVLLHLVRTGLPAKRPGLATVTVVEDIPDEVVPVLPLVRIARTGGASTNPRFHSQFWTNIQVWSGPEAGAGWSGTEAAYNLSQQVAAVLFEAWEAQTETPYGHILKWRESSGFRKFTDPQLPHYGRYVATYDLLIRNVRP